MAFEGPRYTADHVPVLDGHERGSDAQTGFGEPASHCSVLGQNIPEDVESAETLEVTPAHRHGFADGHRHAESAEYHARGDHGRELETFERCAEVGAKPLVWCTLADSEP